MTVLKSKLGICVCIAALGAPSGVSAQQAKNFTPPNVSANGQITGYSPTQGSMVRRKIASSASGSPCGIYLRKRGWTEGINNLGGPREFTVVIGIAPVSEIIDSPDYVDSRYVAFREAFLVGNGNMARALESQVASNASRVLRGGNKGAAREQSPGEKARNLRNEAAKIKMKEKGRTNVQDTTSKGMRLLNALMDKELKKAGHDVEAERKAQNEKNAQRKRELLAQAEKAQKEAKRLTGQRRFKELIEAVARERMKGIYTAFTSENLSPKPKAKTQICTILKHSLRSEKLADMMAARDFSNASQLEPDIHLTDQLPDPSTGQGVFQLVTMWGLNVMVNENGHVNLVAFGQAGYPNGDENLQLAAKEEAKLRAEGLIRLFINQTVAVRQKAKISQDVKSYKEGIKKTNLTKSLMSKMEQGGAFAPINGMKQILDWDGVHPITNGGIAGAIVAWNANEAAGAIESKARQNRVVKDRGGVKALNNSGDGARSGPRSSRPPSRRGGLRGSTRSKDF